MIQRMNEFVAAVGCESGPGHGARLMLMKGQNLSCKSPRFHSVLSVASLWPVFSDSDSLCFQIIERRRLHGVKSHLAHSVPPQGKV